MWCGYSLYNQFINCADQVHRKLIMTCKVFNSWHRCDFSMPAIPYYNAHCSYTPTCLYLVGTLAKHNHWHNKIRSDLIQHSKLKGSALCIVLIHF